MNVNSPSNKQQIAFNEALAENRKQLERSRREYENKLDRAENSHRGHLEKLRDYNENDKVSLVKDFNNDIGRQNEQFQDILSNSIKQNRKEMEMSQAEHNHERDKLKFSFARQLAILEKSYERALEAKQDEINSIRERNANLMSFMKKEHADEINGIIENYEERFKKAKAVYEKNRWEKGITNV